MGTRYGLTHSHGFDDLEAGTAAQPQRSVGVRVTLTHGHFMRVIRVAARHHRCLTSETRRPGCDPFSELHQDSAVAGTPELGLLGIDPSRGGPLSHTQAGMLVGAEEAPKLEVIVAR